MFNGAVGWFTRMGLPLRGQPCARGARPHQRRVARDARQSAARRGGAYLVAPRGHTQWVRNLRVAGGGRLRKGRQVEEFTADEIADAEKPPILREYLRVWAWEVGRFFEGVDASSPEERLLEIAPDFPVFRIRRVRMTVHASFPDAEYLVLSSRLIPDRDGGYTLATLARARQMAAAGRARRPRTAAAHASTRAHRPSMPSTARRSRDATSSSTRRACATCSTRPPARTAERRVAAGRGASGRAGSRRSNTGDRGRRGGPVVALPVIAGDPDWHITTAPIVVYDRNGGGRGRARRASGSSTGHGSRISCGELRAADAERAGRRDLRVASARRAARRVG